MKQDEWSSRLYDRLADYEEPVPEELWAGIEAALAKQEASKPAPVAEKPTRRIPLWGKWTIAAAFAGLVIGNGYLLWINSEESLDIPVVSQAPKAIVESRPSAKVSEPEVTVLAVIQPEPQFVGEPEKQTAGEPEKQTVEKPAEPASQPESKPEARPEIRQLPEPEENRAILAELDRKIAAAKHRRSNSVAFGLYASNGFGDQQHRNGVLMSPELLANYDYGHAFTRAGDSRVWLYNYEERQKHYQPISFGLTVKIPISSAFSLSTGVAYTRLRSDFTNIANGYPIEQKQTLHYLGIPLSGQYHLWRLYGLNVYATAGGQMDINVKAKYVSSGTEVEFRKDRLQFSVQGALGLQYDIIPQLGVYAEPGIKYYFDNGSHVRNFFKDKPTNFNLQLGLRLNL
ncbi:MAG: outer membrane beta-barrel protein [Prevotella sp.]|nr:outer membrane beta-barrel protein [Prevotella sp.]